MYLLRYSQHVNREEDGAFHFWRIEENLQKHFLHCLHWFDSKWKACLAGGGETRKGSSTVLILQEQLCISELFRVIEDAILLIQLYKTM